MFTQLDSVTGKPTDPRSMNRFLYAEGNPWSMVDPSGHASSYEGGGCGQGGKYCGSTGNDQNFHKNIKTVIAKAHNDYVHHPKARMYDPESTPSVSSEWATGDTWGENTSIGITSGSSSGGIREFQYADGEDGPVGALKGVVGGVGDFAVGAITTPIYALAHLSDAAAGLQCFGMDGCLAGAAHDLGWDHPVDNLGAGWDAFVHMSDQDKAKFATGITLTALTLRAGFKGIRGGEPSASLADEPPTLTAAAQVQAAADTVAARGPVALTPAQAAAAAARPGLLKAFQGYNFHQEVAAFLRGSFDYSYRGVDFTQVGTGAEVELTTSGQAATHLARYPQLTPAQIVTYQVP